MKNVHLENLKNRHTGTQTPGHNLGFRESYPIRWGL